MVQTTGTRSNLCPGQGRGWQSPHGAMLNSCRGGNDTPHYPAFVQGRDQNAPGKKKKRQNKTKRDYSGLHHSLLSPLPPLQATGDHLRILAPADHRALWPEQHLVRFSTSPMLPRFLPAPCFLMRNHGHKATQRWVWLASKAGAQERPAPLLLMVSCQQNTAGREEQAASSSPAHIAFTRGATKHTSHGAHAGGSPQAPSPKGP